jgi:hypothetical protein
MSGGHLHGGDTPTEAEGEWLTFSAALSDQIGVIADRDDLMVTAAPGAGRGAPACFLPALAAIEVDGELLDTDPATCAPQRPQRPGRC